MRAMDYKAKKESFVSNGQGGGSLELLVISFNLMLTIFLWRLIQNLTGHQKHLAISLSIEFLILIFPILAFTTFLSNKLWSSAIFLSSITLIILVKFHDAFRPSTIKANHHPSSQDFQPQTSDGQSSNNQIRHQSNHGIIINKSSNQIVHPISSDTLLMPEIRFQQPFLTVYRSQMMLMTVICILAVDFNVFPRKFAKTESWGVSLMDLGVGSFVFSSGIMSALPILKQTPTCKSWTIDLWKNTRSTMPLLVLGIIRIILVKGADYPEHVTEYAVHWNFFFTLSILPTVGVLVRRAYKTYRLDFTLLGFLTALAYQYILSAIGLQDYVLSEAPRTNLISANREGLASIPSYIIIYLFGLSTGCYVLPFSPDFLRKLSQGVAFDKLCKRKPGKALVVYSSWSIIWWIVYLGSASLISKPSRRLANPTYCFWVAAMNLTLITGNCLFESIELDCSGFLHNQVLSSPPKFFQSINQNSLFVFLISNLLTGLINFRIETIFVTNMLAIITLLFYLVIILALTWKLRNYKLKI
ncbi:hypothetical protein O181_001232 [Austropuccinia psidii MF-1]|uniref:GPI-anchored wall transfer protein n=1 Tax=Austropuccinia psidii MF-1 TaxID=1389203 RepID=A0A9Q3GCU2_9BASI|nr:hypothetical protein [Austropuccinia psidii MF-1]